MSFLVNKRGNFLKELCCGISGRYHKIHVVIFIIWFDKKYSFLCKWKAKLSLLKGTNTKRKKKDNLVLSPELRMQIGLCKESLELTFQVLTFCHSLWQRANAQNISYRNSLPWPICIIDLVDKTNLFFERGGGHLIIFCNSPKLLTIL